jgi:rubrerythrin
MERKQFKLNESEIKEALQITEGVESAGSLELHSTDVKKAAAFADKVGLLKELPDFEKNYNKAKKIVSIGKTRRNEMPVIEDKDVRAFQDRLKNGKIDVTKPFAPTTNQKDPFPQGLRGMDADDFLKRGLDDGSKSDDKVGISITSTPADKLKPIQKQIYADKSIEATAKFGVKGTTAFLTGKTFFITSADNFIIDGHHRFLSAMLVDPKMKVNALSIDLPIKKLLPLAKAYGDSIGNARNESEEEIMNPLSELISRLVEEESAHQKKFREQLKKFGVKSPAELSDEKKKEFFDAVDAGTKAENESKQIKGIRLMIREALNEKAPQMKKDKVTKVNKTVRLDYNTFGTVKRYVEFAKNELGVELDKRNAHIDPITITVSSYAKRDRGF